MAEYVSADEKARLVISKPDGKPSVQNESSETIGGKSEEHNSTAVTQHRNKAVDLPETASPLQRNAPDIKLDDDNGSVIRTTTTQSLMHLLKGMIGTGVLAMPVAYKNGGLWVSLVTVFVIGVICTHCMYQLVICSEVLCKRIGVEALDYGQVMEEAFRTSSFTKVSRLSKKARHVVNAFLILTQYGFCCVYTVFVAQNIQQVVEQFSDPKLNGKVYIVFVSIALAPYVMIRNLKALAPFSTFANLINLTGMIIIFYNLLSSTMDVNNRKPSTDIGTLPLFFGQVMFAFEGIGLVLPIQNKMKDKKSFVGWNGVLNTGLLITISLYDAMGFFGYLVYGDDSKGSITLNLPGDEPLYIAVKLMFAVSLFISYALQFYVPVSIVYPALSSWLQRCKIYVPPKYGEHIFRLVMVCVICGLASLVPHLDLLIALVGAFASSYLALIFPPLIEIVTFAGTDNPPSKWMLGKNGCIVAIGIIGWGTGTYTAIDEISKTF